MTDLTEKEAELLGRGRSLRMALPTLLPLLSRQTDQALMKLLAEFRGGEKDLVSSVAYLAALDDLRNMIDRNLKELNHIEEKIHARPNQ